MTGIESHNAGAAVRLQEFRIAASPLGAPLGLLTGLRDRLTPNRSTRAARNLDAWNALKVTLNQTHGRSGALAMRAMRDDYTQGKPLTPARIKSVIARADAYAAARKLLAMQAKGRTLNERDVARSVKALRNACAMAAKANPGAKQELTPEAVIDSLVRDLPASQIRDISGKPLALASDIAANPKNLSEERQSKFTETNAPLVEFARQDLLRTRLEKTQALEAVQGGERLGEGVNGSTFTVAVPDKDTGEITEKVYKPFVYQTLTGGDIRFASATRCVVDGALSAARATGSDRIAQLLGCTQLVGTQFAVREDDDVREFGILMDKAPRGARTHDAVERARPALARLQMADWICGQRDRHLNNVSIGPDGSVKAFDHDDSFGLATNPGRYMGCALMAPPPMIDTEMRANLERLATNPDVLRQSLQNILDEPNIEAAVTRLSTMWNDVESGKIAVVNTNEWPQETFVPKYRPSNFPEAKPEPASFKNVTSYAELFHQSIEGNPVFRWHDPYLSDERG